MVAPGDRRVGYLSSMLGLPDGARACLFDLDGVLTDTASVHAAAWKQMFDDYLRARAERDGTPFRPFDVKDDYGPYVDGRPGWTAPAASSSRAASSCREGSPDDPPDAETLWGLSTRKNDLVQEKIRTVGVDVYPGSVRYLQAVKEAGLLTACVSSSANAEQVLEVAGLSASSTTGSTGWSPSSAACPASPPPTRSSPPRPISAWPRSRPSSSRTRWPAWQSGRAGGFGYVVGVDRVGHADALREHGADVVVQDLAELLTCDGRRA